MAATIDERMEQIRADLIARAETEGDDGRRRLLGELQTFAEAIQEHARTLDFMRAELDEIRHVMGVR